MTDPNSTPEPVVNIVPPVVEPNNPPVESDDKGMIPKSRLDEVIAQRNELREAVEQRKADDKKVADDKLIKDGEHETLIAQKTEENAELQRSKEKWDAYQKSRRDAIYEKLSDSQKLIAERIGDLEGLELYAVEVFGNKNIITQDGSPGIQNGNFGGYGSRAEYATKDPDGYMKWKLANTKQPGFVGTVRMPGDSF